MGILSMLLGDPAGLTDPVNRLVFMISMNRNKSKFGWMDRFQLWSYLDAKYSPNDTDEVGKHPLYYMAKSGNLRTVKLLLKYKANVNYLTKLNETAISVACQKQRYEIVELLLEHDADCTIVDKSSYSPLRWAAELKDYRLIQTLLESSNISLLRDQYTLRNAVSIVVDKNDAELANFINEYLVKECRVKIESLGHIQEGINSKLDKLVVDKQESLMAKAKQRRLDIRENLEKARLQKRLSMDQAALNREKKLAVERRGVGKMSKVAQTYAMEWQPDLKRHGCWNQVPVEKVQTNEQESIPNVKKIQHIIDDLDEFHTDIAHTPTYRMSNNAFDF